MLLHALFGYVRVPRLPTNPAASTCAPSQVPAWPFVALSFFFGAFALLPYMALWRPIRDPATNPLPPPVRTAPTSVTCRPP
jgi:hypothetical protein